MVSEISEKEVEAALSAWNNYNNSGPVAEDRSDAMRVALSAAARVRAEDNAGGPVAWGEDIDGKIVSVRLDKSRHCTVPLYRAPQPSGPVGALADALRGLLKAYENAFDWTAELPPETAEAERIANEVLEALTSSKPEQSGWKLVPKEPSRGRLISMAIRHNHAFLINPDPSATWWSSGVKPEHRESILRNMKQLYEEAIGEGFYSPDKEAGYVTSFEKAQGSASPTPPTAGGE